MGRHTSVDKELKQAIRWLESLPIVKKVILGFCEAARHKYSPGTLQYAQDARGGVNLKAYGGTGIMKVYVQTDDTTALLELLRKRNDE